MSAATLGWLLVAFIAAFFVAAHVVALYLSGLSWIAGRKAARARRLLEAVKDSMLADPIHFEETTVAFMEAVGILQEALNARERYVAACHRWGLEP